MSDLNVYIGCYFELPKKVNESDWNDFLSKHEDDERFSDFMLVDDKRIVFNVMNKFTHYLDNTTDNLPVEINDRIISLAQIYFAAQAKNLLTALKEDYGITPDILYGAIPYYV